LQCWYKADNGAIVTSGSVSSWIDVSGNGFTATQGTSGSQPTFVSSAINGLPTLAFNGTSQNLVMPTSPSNFTSGLTIFVMAKPIAFTNAYNRLVDFGTTAGPAYTNSLAFYQPVGSTSYLGFTVYGNPYSTNVSTVQSSSGLAFGLYQLFETVDDGSSTATIYVNGVPLAQNTSMISVPNVTRNNNHIALDGVGISAYFNGQISEILVYSQTLTDAQRLAVENYLLNRYYGQTAVAAPIFSLPTSTLTAPNQIAISGPPGSSVLYSVDGTAPSLTYSGPLQINFTQTVKAAAVVNGVSSSVASVTLTLDSLKFPTPSASDTRPLTINLQLPATNQ